MPDRLGPDFDGDGLIDYAGSAEEFEGREAAFVVDLAVRADLCRDGLSYVWRSAAGTTTARGREGCRVRQRFDREGTYPVSLQVRDEDGRVASYNRDVEVQDWLIVSIGDSVASGEGNPEVEGLAGKATWQSARCHRSSLASPAKAALALEAGDPRSSTTFVHLACSGAEIGLGLLRPYRGIDPAEEATPLPPQVKELERIAATRAVDAVLVSIGANDVSFGPMVSFCIRTRNCVKKPFDPRDPENPVVGQAPPLEQVVETALGRLQGKYAELADRLAGVVEPQRTLIVDYFDPTRDENGRFCRIGVPDPIFRSFQIDPTEAEFAATRLLAPLNREVAKAAGTARWTEVTGVAEASRTHGYCAEEPWVRHFFKSFISQGGNRLFSRVAGALHPNEDGHRETALLLGGALQRVLGQGEQPASDAGEVAIDELSVTVDPPGEESDSDGEGDAEGMALIVLPIVALLAALTVFVLMRLLGRSDPPFEYLQGETIDAPLPTAWPDPESVAAFGWMLEASPEEASVHWVHRRVESIEILDETLVRRRVSVDFTPQSPRGLPTHAPIALLSKGTLTRFDLRDEAGASVPLLTREQNAAFSTAHMLAIAREAARAKDLSDDLPEDLVRLCWRVAQGEPYEANEAIYDIATYLEPVALREALSESDRFREATKTFANSFPVIVAVGDPRRSGAVKRRVIKLAYNHVLLGSGPTRRQRLGIDPILLWFEIPELGDASSRHIEFLKADGLDAFNPQLIGFAPDGTYIASEGSEEGGEPHLAVAGAPRGSRGGASVSLRAARAGILVGGPLLAALSAAALTAAWFALPQLAGETAGSAASILLAVPAALGAYLSSRQPHPLEAALLAGPRRLVFFSGMLAFFGAAALALDSSVEPLRFIIGGLALLSWLPVVGLALTYFLPAAPPGEDSGAVL